MTKTDKHWLEIQGLQNRIENLGQQCATWHDGLYKSSNAELYSILQGCFNLLVELRASSSLRKKFGKALELAGHTVQANTSLSLQIARAVFKSGEHRMYGYARVLEVAHAEKRADQTLADFIVSKGGIEEIRRTPKDGVSPAVQRKAYKELAGEALANVPALCQIKALPELKPHPDGNEFAVALVRRNDDGTMEIVFGSNKITLVQAVLAEAGKALGEQKAQRQTVTQHTEHRQQRVAMLDEMAA